MLGAAREESNETKPVNSGTVIPPFTASHAWDQLIDRDHGGNLEKICWEMLGMCVYTYIYIHTYNIIYMYNIILYIYINKC